jgi:hypothetical protein
LSFDEITTESCCDYVEVFDGSSSRNQSIGKFSGFNITANLISSSNSLTVHFRTDESVVLKGFSAKYVIKRNGECIS